MDKASEDEDAMYEAVCPCDFDLPDADGFPFRLIHDREIRAILKRVHPQVPCETPQSERQGWNRRREVSVSDTTLSTAGKQRI